LSPLPAMKRALQLRVFLLIVPLIFVNYAPARPTPAAQPSDAPASGQLTNPLTSKEKRDALNLAILTMHKYLNQFFTSTRLAEIAKHPSVVAQRVQVEDLTDVDTEIGASSLTGVFLASVLMTLSDESSNSLSQSERDLGRAFIEASSGYSGITDEVTLRKIPAPPKLEDNAAPEISDVLAAVRWYHAMVRLAMLDPDAGIRELAFAEGEQGPRVIRDTDYFLSLYGGKVIRRQEQRQIPMTAMVVRRADASFIAVERFYDLNLDAPGFPERLPDSAETDVRPTRYRVLTFTDGDPAIDIHEQPRDKNTLGEGERIVWNHDPAGQPTAAAMVQELVKEVGAVTGPGKDVLLDSRTVAVRKYPTERVQTAQATASALPTSTGAPGEKQDKEVPNLTARAQSAQAAKSTRTFADADKELAGQMLSLFDSHLKGLSDASDRYKILQAMSESFEIAAPNQTSSMNAALAMPNMQKPLDCKLIVYRTPAMNALSLLAQKEKGKKSENTALEVLWSVTAQSNAALVEYAVEHRDFVSTVTALRTEIYSTAKQFRTSGQPSEFQKIWSDAEFVRGMQSYTRAWFDYWFASQWQLYAYLGEHVTIADLKDLIRVAGRSEETQPAIPLLEQLARNLALFTGQTTQVADITPLDLTAPALGVRPTFGDIQANIRTPCDASGPQACETRQQTKLDFKFTQTLWNIASVDLSKQKNGPTSGGNEQVLRRYFVINDLLRYSITTPDDLKTKFVTGDWDGLDVRRALPLLAEIANRQLKTQPDGYTLILNTGKDSERIGQLFPWLWKTSK